MKILFVFWDMARINLLNKFDSKNAVTDIDMFLDTIGGTLYTNCYTPAPDTPRSLASMQTGLYPHSNGCDTRIKWPKFFLNKEKITIFDQFDKASFKQLFYLPEKNYNTGPFSERAYQYGNFFHDRHKFKEAVKKHIDGDGNLFAHIHLQDYHWAIDDHGANKKGAKIGKERVVDFTESFFNDINIDSFDYVFIFSDHGHKYKKEIITQNKLELLNGDRTNILMHVRRKDEYRVSKNKKLCSIFDIFPTIQEILKYKDVNNDGISLFSKKEHSEIIIEDHSEFNVEPIQGLSVWAVRKIKSLYITNIVNELYFEDNIIKEISKSVRIKNIELISKKSPVIKDYKRKLEVLDYYKTLGKPGDKFSNGSKRQKRNFFNKIIKFINNVIY
jgi:hypothetical protein